MRASLAMYARPETQAALNAFWSVIRNNLREKGLRAPEGLTEHGFGVSFWLLNDLVLSQACSRPYRRHLKGRVRVVGAFDYGLEGCEPGYYRSALIVRRDDERQHLSEFGSAVNAVNGEDSHSGHAALFSSLDARDIAPGRIEITGSHRASAMAVSAGKADIASLDAVTWALIRRYDPFEDTLRVLEWTVPSPGLPLITSLRNDVPLLQQAISKSLENLDVFHRETLMIRGFVPLTPADYLRREPE